MLSWFNGKLITYLKSKETSCSKSPLPQLHVLCHHWRAAMSNIKLFYSSGLARVTKAVTQTPHLRNTYSRDVGLYNRTFALC